MTAAGTDVTSGAGIPPVGGVMRKVARDMRRHRRRIILATAALVLSTVGTVAVPWAVRYGIDDGVETGGTSALLVAVLAGLAAAAVAAFGQGVAIDLVARVGEGWLRDVRLRLVRHTLGQPLEFFDTEQTGRLVSRLTSDVEAVQELLTNGLTMFVQSGLVLVLSVVSLFVMSWELALVTLAVLPLLVLVTVWFRRRAGSAYDTVREAIATVLTQLQENLAGIREVQAHGRRRHRLDLFGAANEAHYDRNMHAAFVSSLYFPAVEFLGVAALALVLGYGGWQVISGGAGPAVTVGTITAFLLLVGNVFDPIQHLSQLYNVVQSAQSALRRVYGLLEHGSVPGQETPRDGDGILDVRSEGTHRGAAVRVEGVSYRYPGSHSDAISGVSLEVRAGERLALVGETGAGKSTLAKLLVRLHDPTSGTIRLDGVDMTSIEDRAIRERALLVPQEGHVFSGTLEENVRFGKRDASPRMVGEAVRATGIDRVAASLPDGLETVLGHGGAALSAGQRQLVGLSRILLADPDLLVLDEATSALDPVTERSVERALEAVMVGRTTVLVVHRLSTAARCERIGVLRWGRIVELGTHAELLAAGGEYASLWEHWTQSGPRAPDDPPDQFDQ